MKKKYIVLTVILLAEIIGFIYCIDGISLFCDEPQSETFKFILSLIILNAFMAFITIGGMIRLKTKEKFSLIKNILMLPLTIPFYLGIGYFTIYKLDDSWIAGIFFLCVGLIFVGLMHIQKSKPKEKYQYHSYCFTHLKAKWSYDAVLKEYCRIHCITEDSLTDNDKENIEIFSSNWILYFIQWLVEHDFYVYDNELSNETIKNPSELFESTDNCLSIENIKPELNSFMAQYFIYDNSRIGKYMNDYLSVVHRSRNDIDYCFDYSEDLYTQIKKLIDLAYQKYCMQNESDELNHADQFYCEWLPDFEIEVFASEDITTEYINKCIEHFNSLPDKMMKQMVEKIKKYMLVEDIDDDTILSQCNLDTMTIYKPYDDRIVYIIGGEPDFELEHGMAFVICDDSILDIGYRYDVECVSPWLELIFSEVSNISESL